MPAAPHFVNFTLTDLPQIIDIDKGVVIKLDEIHGRFGGNLVNDFACLYGSVTFVVVHTLAYHDIPAYFWCHVYWRMLWHDVEFAFNVVIQEVVNVQDWIFVVGNVEPGLHDRHLV